MVSRFLLVRFGHAQPIEMAQGVEGFKISPAPSIAASMGRWVFAVAFWVGRPGDNPDDEDSFWHDPNPLAPYGIPLFRNSEWFETKAWALWYPDWLHDNSNS